jgi:hypothetical protein
MKRNRRVSGSTRNSTVPALRYPTSAASRTAAALIAASVSASSAVDADSSITFWLRRCTLQSRTPTAQVVPAPSAITWTSTWRALSTNCSRNTAGSPKASSASPRAEARAPAIWSGERTTRIPRPPPPADAFSTTG